ncbi:DinB superfamily protein [Mariniphaga anaerophila]|uniref:DinB superfamily protein n=1 Tax=Mariniphaga anaerophila TaxID=1484053 RepID=A0A1M4WCQ9_9BACT|nr:DinB family protein [Mariniphaga anaerophila]SHE79014.1 DinB superfamily protein [Mariniphaga anaerophila]
MKFSTIANQISELVNKWVPVLETIPEKILTEKKNWQNRTIKQVVGHLVDSASNNHQRIVRLQYNKKLVFPDFQQDNDLWISLQDYQDEDWDNLVFLWKYYNRHLSHVICSLNLDKIENTWNNFEGTRVTLEQVIEGYLWHLELHLKEIECVLQQH